MTSYTHKRVRSADSESQETKRSKIADSLPIQTGSPADDEDSNDILAGSLFSGEETDDEDSNDILAGSLFSGEETDDIEVGNSQILIPPTQSVSPARVTASPTQSASPTGSLFSDEKDNDGVSSAGSLFSGEEIDYVDDIASPTGSLFSAASEDSNENSSAGSLFSGEEIDDIDCQQSFTINSPTFPSPSISRCQTQCTSKLTKPTNQRVQSSVLKNAGKRQPANPQLISQGSAKSKIRKLNDPPAWATLPHCTSQSHPHPHLPGQFAEYLEQCSARMDGAADSPSCPLLEFFQLKWDNLLNCLYCCTHHRLLPGNYVWQHISRQHKDRHSGIRRSSLLEAFLGHLKGCHPTIVDQSTEDLKKNLPCSLNYPLSSHSSSIALRYKCQVSSCLSWISANNSKGAHILEYVRHLKSKHKLDNKEHEIAIQVQPQWTEMVEIAGGKSQMGKGGDVHWFLLPSYSPDYNGACLEDGPAIFKSTQVAAASELWPTKIGWCNELEQISMCLGLPLTEVINILQDLARPPSLDIFRKCDDEITQSIEHGLIQSNKLSLKYFSEGLQWVDGNLCAFGFLFPDERLWTSSEAFLIRTLSKLVKEPRYQRLLLCSPEVTAAGIELLRLFMSSQDLNPHAILERKHNLYLAFLQDEHSSAKIGTIPELALLSRCLLGTNKWRTAYHVRTLVVGGIWCLRGTVVNWCYRTFANRRLSENAECVEVTKGFDALDVGDDFEEMEDEEDEEDEEDLEEQEQLQDMGPSISSIPTSVVNDLVFQISSRLDIKDDDFDAFNSQTSTLDDFFGASSYYLTTTEPPRLTMFYRMSTISLALYDDATFKPPFQTTFEGDHFMLSNGINAPLSIPLSGLMVSAHRAVRDLGNAVQALLPQGLQLETFPFSQLTDNFSNEPLHAQSPNKPLLEPFLMSCQQEILQRFYGKWGLNRVEMDRWLGQYDDCYITAAAAISLTTGGFGNTTFKHQCYSGPHRSVFLLKTGILAFINPLASRRKVNYQIDLMAIPPEPSQYLLVLFTILLQIAIELRCLKGQHHPNASTHLWVLHHKLPNGEKPWLFDSNHSNRQLQIITHEALGLPLSARTIFRMQTGLLRAKLPLLFSEDVDFRSAVDDLAQHHYMTGVRNYGRLKTFPNSPFLVGDKPMRLMTISEIWQGLLGFGPVRATWREMIKTSAPFSSIDGFRSLAFRTARHEVLDFYNILNCSPTIRKDLVSNLLENVPFLDGIEVNTSDDHRIGDQALLSVMKTLLFGTDMPKEAFITQELFAEAAILANYKGPM
ncbi:hypothetical protein F5887DRAFT_922500 [Amanita rubescens]|nr:hypothetical protein F5887DRAFT_922500 [Amanita rubescens]